LLDLPGEAARLSRNGSGAGASTASRQRLSLHPRKVSMIIYTESTKTVTAEQLTGFFSHWLRQPAPEALLRILKGSDYVVIAVDSEDGEVAGYITAISDGVSCAYIPHLEVRESRRGEGIGSELVRRMVAQLQHLYMVDLICDPDLRPFYERLGFRPIQGMAIRNYDRQRCD
jgi:GNAT superfamily N-acetyltransferase